MRRGAGVDFLGLTNTFRSLTASPMTAAINEAHRMARRRLEAGGAVGSPHAAERAPSKRLSPEQELADLRVAYRRRPSPKLAQMIQQLEAEIAKGKQPGKRTSR